MSGSFQKVRRGDPLVIPAATYNAFIDAALAQRNNQHNVTRRGAPAVQVAETVLIRNDSGTDQPRGNILGIAGPRVSPTDDVQEFKNQVSLVGVEPGADDEHLGRFAILTEPIRADELGKARVAGVCPVQVEMVDPTHMFADVTPGVTDRLRSSATGTARLLWTDGDEGTVWALVRIGNGGGVGFGTWVRVKQSGGDWGDATTRCSWEYDLYPTGGPMDAETRIIADVTNVLGRAPAGRYHAARDGTYALALVDPDGDPAAPASWTLLVVTDEVEDIAVCNSAPVGG